MCVEGWVKLCGRLGKSVDEWVKVGERVGESVWISG